MQTNIGEIPEIMTNSLRLIGKHWYIYIVLIGYMVVAGIVMGSIAFIGLSLITGLTMATMIETGTFGDTLMNMSFGIGVGILFSLVIFWAYIAGFLGGLGQMLKRLISTNQVMVGEYITGAFSTGSRLFFGFIGYGILILIPVIWGFSNLIEIYGLFDSATLDSGWNSQLRHSIGLAHSGTIFRILAIQIVVSILLGFWWVVSICETRSFLPSSFKSIAFVIRNPVLSISSLALMGLGMFVMVSVFSSLFMFTGYGSFMGSAIGAVLFLPFQFIFLIQIYDYRYRNVLKINQEPRIENPILTGNPMNPNPEVKFRPLA